MANSRVFNHLPAVFKTDTQKRFFDATAEQLFSKPSSEKVYGFIGRRIPGVYSPLKDYYLSQTSADRAWNMLEPAVMSKNKDTLEVSNLAVLEDLIHRISYLGSANTANYNKMFSSRSYTYAPPIDYDKFLNYPLYYWVPSESVELVGVSYADVEGHQTFQYKGVDLVDGTFVNFGGNNPIRYRVTNVGTSINLVQTKTAHLAPDYITIRYDSKNENDWSLNNFWIHTDAVNCMIAIKGKKIAASIAKRNIIEFLPNIELFNYGTQKLVGVTVATSEKFYSIDDRVSNAAVSTAGSARIDNVKVSTGDSVIFVDDDSSVAYNNLETFIITAPGPHVFKLDTPFSNTTDLSVIVKRPLTPASSSEPYQLFVEPISWYVKNEIENTITFQDDVLSYNTDVFSEVGSGNTVMYTNPLSNITGSPTSVRVLVDSVEVTNFVWTVTDGNLIVIFDDSVVPANSSTITITAVDKVFGLQLGDIVDVYVSSNITSTDETSASGSVVTFNIEGIESSNIIGLQEYSAAGDVVYHYTHGVSDDTVIDNISVSPSHVIVNFTSARNASNTFKLVTKNYNAISYKVSQCVWVIHEGQNGKVQLLPKIINGLQVVRDGDIVDVEKGIIYHNTRFYNDEQHWVQTVTNKKLGVNTPPLFNLYYSETDNGNPVQLSNATHFPGSNFSGSEIFSYKVNTNNPIDSETNKQLEYKNLGQRSDVVFENDLETQRFFYNKLGIKTEIPGYYYYKVSGDTSQSYENSWVLSKKSVSRVIDRHLATVGQKIYALSVEPKIRNNEYQVSGNLEGRDLLRSIADTTSFSGNGVDDVFEIALTPGTIVSDVVVRMNGTIIENYNYVADDQTLQIAFDFVPLAIDDFAIDMHNGDFYIDCIDGNWVAILTNNKYLITKDYDVVEFRTASDYDLPEQAAGYYEIPNELESNALLQEITTISANELSGHFASILLNQDGFAGDIYGNNNYRFLTADFSVGDQILQTTGTLAKAMLSISDKSIDIANSLRFSKTEYARYKDRFVKTAGQLIRESWSQNLSIPFNETEQLFNEIVSRLVNTSEYFGAFDKSGMFAWGEVYNTLVYTGLANGVIQLPADFDVSHPNNAVLIFRDSVTLLEGSDYAVSGNQIELFGDLSVITLKVVFYSNIQNSVCPSTPSKIGLEKVYVPGIVLDDKYTTPIYMIVGHDGSKTPMYSNADDVDTFLTSLSGTAIYSLDLRDRALLELETRIYNNIVPKFKNEYLPLYSVYDVKPGFYRHTDYSLQEFNDTLIKDFLRWTQRNGINYDIHNVFNYADYRTWNYKLANPDLPGTWKGIFLHLYDTYNPNTAPWEMLGFSIKPLWWDTEYGIDYASSNSDMWADIAAGFIRSGIREGYDIRFMRPNMVIPVDEFGDIIAPHLLGVGINTPTSMEASADWEFGDFGPVEEAWSNTSEYLYALSECLFILKPGVYGEVLFDTDNTVVADINKTQIVQKSTLKRRGSLKVHNAKNVIAHGYQRFVADFLLFNNKDVETEYTSKLENMGVKLAHRVAGFTNKESLKLLLEGSTSYSGASKLSVPDENISVLLHTGQPIKEYVYSGVIVRITDDKRYQVTGYDVLTPEFRVYPRSRDAESSTVSVGGKPAPYRDFSVDTSYLRGEYVRFNNKFYQSRVDQIVQQFGSGLWAPISELPSVGGKKVEYVRTADKTSEVIVEYGTILGNEQELFNFLIGYGDWLEEQGWSFNNIDAENNVELNWESAAKDALFWTTTQWKENNVLYISPGADKITLNLKDGYAGNIETIANGVYSILDYTGSALLPSNTQIKRSNRKVEVTHKTPNTGIYSLRIPAQETEHVIVVDNVTAFNDIVYDALLNARQNRLEMQGIRTTNWIGKFEADGYLISGSKLIPNLENITESIRYYYDPIYDQDVAAIEHSARHLIGFDNRDYLENLKLFDSAQFQFYKSMLPEKGTILPIKKILRSEYISSDFTLYEEWAFKMGEFGSINDSATIEVLVDSNVANLNPRTISLDYTTKNKYGSVLDVVVLNAETVYTSAPLVQIDPPTDENGILIYESVEAKAVAVLGADGKLLRVNVVSPGKNYLASATPKVTFRDSVSGSITNDRAVANVKHYVTSGLYDDVTVIDIYDRDKWLSKPAEIDDERLVPEMEEEAITVRIPNAGYVHKDDVDFTLWDINSIDTLWTNFTDIGDSTTSEEELEKPKLPIAGNYIWVVGTYTDDKPWTVLRLTDSIIDNDFSGRAMLSGVSYSYSPETALNFDDVLTYTKLSGGEIFKTKTQTDIDKRNEYDIVFAEQKPLEYQDAFETEYEIQYAYFYETSYQDKYDDIFSAKFAEYNTAKYAELYDVAFSKHLAVIRAEKYSDYYEIELRLLQELHNTSITAEMVAEAQAKATSKINLEAQQAASAEVTREAFDYAAEKADIDAKESATEYVVSLATPAAELSAEIISSEKADKTAQDAADKILSGADFSSLNPMFFKDVRFANMLDAELSGENRVWVDNYNGWYFRDTTRNIERKQGRLVNSSLFLNSYLYDYSSNKTLVNLPIYDTFKGYIPGQARQNVSYISLVDPVEYGANNISFGKNNVGQLWWDVSTCRVLYYEQGSIEYRRENWGKFVDGSVITIYEWVESNLPPISYTGSGTIKNITDFVVENIYDNETKQYTYRYYFWVKNRTDKSDNVNRTLTAASVAALIADPMRMKYSWFAFINKNTFIFSNVDFYINDLKTVMQINYKFRNTDNEPHTEWKLIGENNPLSEIPNMLWDKMVDSLVGFDINGNFVPNAKLSDFEKYGIKNTPVQTMFVDIQAARNVFVEAANRLLANIYLPDVAGWKKTNMSTAYYWELTEWYREGYTSQNTTPVLQTIKYDLSEFEKEKLATGDIVKVYDPEKNTSTYYEYSTDEEFMSKIVRVSDSALKLKDALFLDSRLDRLTLELREILNVLRTVIFTGEHVVNQNKLYFSLLHYISGEQQDVDWYFKTTYVTVGQSGQEFTKQAKTYQANRTSSVQDYITEIKPYQTKIRSFTESLDGHIEDVTIHAYDHDSLLYTTDPDTDVSSPVVNPAYNPELVRRDIDVFTLYDNVQCGFEDKEFFVEMGHQAQVADGSSTRFVFGYKPRHYKVLVDGVETITGFTASVSAPINLILTFLLPPPSGATIKVEEYSPITDENVYHFGTVPNIAKLYLVRKQVYTSGTEVGKVGTSARLLDKEEYTVSVSDKSTDFIQVTLAPAIVALTANNNSTVVYAGGEYTISYELTVVAGVNFVHTAVEEMRLVYNTARYQSTPSLQIDIDDPKNTTDLRTVTFDVALDYLADASGFGAYAWEQFLWNTEVHLDTVPDEIDVPVTGWNMGSFNYGQFVTWNKSGVISIKYPVYLPNFVVNSGSAARLLLAMPKEITDPIYRFSSNNGAILYSDYSERGNYNPASSEELRVVKLFNSLCHEIFNCRFEGTVIDAKDFMYLNGDSWDNAATEWEDMLWDASSATPIIRVDEAGSEHVATFFGVETADLDVSLRLPSVVDVVQVKNVTTGDVYVDAVDYSVSYDTPDYEGDTLIILASKPDKYVKIEVTFKYTDLFGIDGGTFVKQQYSNGITDELAVFKASSSLVATVRDAAVDANGYTVGERMLITEYGSTEFIKIDPDFSAKLTHSIDLYDTVIEVDNIHAIVYPGDMTTPADRMPSVKEPSIAWVGTEKITFTGVDGNKLTGVQRRVSGTSTSVVNSDPNAKAMWPLGTVVHRNSIWAP